MFGKNLLDSYLSNLNATILNCNIIDAQTKKPFFGVPYDIKYYEDGPTIGIIGATTHYIPNWEAPEHIKNLSFNDASSAIIKTARLIRDKVD